MGNVCSGNGKVTGSRVDDEMSGDREYVNPDNVHVVIVALDYPGTGNELTCTKDGNNMQKLCQQCGVNDVTSLYNNEGNYDRVEQAIRSAGSRCGSGHYLIVYYSGHGTSVPDKDGDEEDGKDEALCLVTPDGKLDWSRFMTDDQFADIVTSSIDEETNFIMLSDCCHSGTIADFDSPDWGDIHGVSISGCTDTQTSGDTGNGGIFTHSMLMGLQEIVGSGSSDEGVSVGKVYNETLDKDDTVFNSKQDISVAWTAALGGANEMAWPLMPPEGYRAPWSN